MMLNHLSSDPLFRQTAVYSTLKSKPLGFVDVGARGGVHPLVEPIAELTAVLGFEPDEEGFAQLQELASNSPWAQFEVEPAALAEGEDDRTLYLLSAPTNHSLLPPNVPFTQRYNMIKFEQVGTFPVKTTNLDRILFQQRPEQDYWGEFLKLDTQGSELEILKGATRTLAERSLVVYTEVEFSQVYAGQRLFSDVELFLRQFGFSFYGFAMLGNRSCKQLDKRRSTGRERLIWADAVFFKDPLPGGFQSTPLGDRANHVLFTCALLLGYYDFALELALKTWATGEESQRIEQLVRQLAELTPEQSYHDAMALAERVRSTPDLATVEVGRFVDQRRLQCDYYDVFLG